MTGASLGYDGNYNVKSLNGIGSFGRWWSSSIYRSDIDAYNLGIDIYDHIDPQRANEMQLGRAVRCVSNLAYQSGNAERTRRAYYCYPL